MENSEFQKRLIPTAYGIHDRIYRSFHDLFESECRHTCFSFYEYVLETPITIYDEYLSIYELQHQPVAAPYLKRFAHRHEIMPAVKSNKPLESLVVRGTQVKMVPYTTQNITDYWKSFDCAMLDLKATHLLGSLLCSWKKGTNEFRYICPTKRAVTFELLDGIAIFTSFFRSASLRRLPKIIGREFSDKCKLIEGIGDSVKKKLAMDELNEITALQLREYALTVMPFLSTNPDRDVCVCVYSLSSRAVFWGQAFVIFPIDEESIGPGSELPQKTRDFVSKLNKLAVREIRDVYVPVLTLLKNTLEESVLKDLYDQKEKLNGRMPQKLQSLSNAVAKSESNLQLLGAGMWRDIGTYLGPSAGFGSEWLFGRLVFNNLINKDKERYLGAIEKRLVELWADRLWRLRHSEEDKNVVDSLLFEKYLVASPELISRVKEAINLNHRINNKKSSVTSALVVGGPGSGKDTMAKLIWLFSPGFRFGGLQIFNMAMFRPKEAAVPLLLGLDLRNDQLKEDASSFPVQFKGMLIKALVKSAAKERKDDKNPRGSSFIFDELNSLDIDTQGALLRFLETAELTPLGGLSNLLDADMNEKTLLASKQILVIGVMNEDPHLIMKRQAMDRILQQSELFGTILGQTLHEMFRNQRRLRDDLYYRLIRGGEILMPCLRDRVEDIPSLFYDYINKSHTMFPEGVKEFEVDLSVYDALMDRTLRWDGNLRELQTLSRNILLEAKEDHERYNADKEILCIRGVHARKAMKRLSESRANSHLTS